MDKIKDGDQYEMTDELRWLFVKKYFFIILDYSSYYFLNIFPIWKEKLLSSV